MPDLSARSYQKELLDNENIPFKDIKRNMEELNFINTWLGGHQISLNGFLFLQKNNTAQLICEIGCGGGDNLAAICNTKRKSPKPLKCIGIDINASCIVYAKQKQRNLKAEWIISDYRNVSFTKKPGIIFSSLFCHHFTVEELIDQFKWMNQNSEIGFFINDLHRNKMAYYTIKWLTAIFSRSYLVKNDAALSVQRGFKRKELEIILEQAGIKNYIVKWKWAFRWLIIVKH
jgi:2-polyprenyl-3-methyl-5-hydroxy-6-metoxy-1,4-benzoquinol methylase